MSEEGENKIDIEVLVDEAKEDGDVEAIHHMAKQLVEKNKELESENAHLNDNLSYAKVIMAVYNKILEDNSIEIPPIGKVA